MQARRCFEIIERALVDAGARIDDVVRARMFLVDAADAEAVGRVHGKVFAAARPAATMVVVHGLLDPRLARGSGSGGRDLSAVSQAATTPARRRRPRVRPEDRSSIGRMLRA